MNGILEKEDLKKKNNKGNPTKFLYNYQDMKTEKFDVTGMTCSACVSHVEKSVSKLEGVKAVNVNLLTNSMIVSFDELQLNPSIIEDSVEDAGYSAHMHDSSFNSTTNSENNIDYIMEEKVHMRNHFWISFAFLIPLMYLSMGHMLGLPQFATLHTVEYAFLYAFLQFWLLLPIVFNNRRYFTNGFRSLIKLSPNMDSLIALGATAAIVYGIYSLFRIYIGLKYGDLYTIGRYSNDLYFESAGTILTLITLGKYLEAKSKGRTSDALKKLMDLAPKTATVIRNKIEIEIPIEDVLPNEMVVVRPGQRVPVDGVVISGNSSVDESALTGESIPVFKQKGDNVLSASINKSGNFTIRATKIGSDTTLSQIIHLVEQASSSKAPISRLADKISSVFVPFVIAVSTTAMAIWWLMGYRFDFILSIGIAVLVISCPCALGLATPVAIMVGTGKGAENGILFKSAEALEMTHKIDTIVLDKTGTITQGKPIITDIIPIKSISKNDLLQLAASLEKPSEHPLSEAILSEAKNKKMEIIPVEDFQSISGMGIQATIDSIKYFAGNKKLMTDLKIDLKEFDDISEKLATEGKTPLFLSNNKEIFGLIAVADVLKPSSKEAIDKMIAMGLEVIMLTGDHAKTAAAIQSQLGLTKVIAEVLPQDKDKEIIKLQAEGKKVAMVGDGINDAPALMRSDVGIAIGSGTDIAIESADVVLIHSDLMDAVNALRLSKNVMVNIKQNLFWAFIYNIIGIPLAAGVFYSVLGWKLNPMFAAAAMSFSSITVVLNALRLLRFKPLKSMIK